ncbi:MAG TPA: hypothetical protein ACFYD6_08850 [Candidatus Brocadiia bacterium]|nr:hypothetical protein [Candidatus Brocadiales bacterium]
MDSEKASGQQIGFVPLAVVTFIGCLITIIIILYGFIKILLSHVFPDNERGTQVKSQCIICEGTEFAALKNLPYLIRCLRCGLLSPMNIPTKEELHEYYQNDPTGFLGKDE